jgi:hypothetical protein
MPEHPMRRQADQGRVGRVKAFAQDWGWAVSVGVFLLLALGFKYTTPRDEINELKTTQASLKASIDTLKNVTKDQAADISTIVRLQCFNLNYTTRQLNLVGIRCDGIRP